MRGARLLARSPNTTAISAAGISQEICIPISLPNSRSSPVLPPKLEPALPPFIPPPLPVLPKSRPNPLYPSTKSMTLLLVDPPMYGRESAGHSHTANTHPPADTTTAVAPIAKWTKRSRKRACPAITYAPASAGNTITPCNTLVKSEPQRNTCEGYPHRGSSSHRRAHCPNHEVAGESHEQNQQCIRIVELEHQGGSRRSGQHSSRHRTRSGRRHSFDGHIHECNRSDAHQCLRN